MIGPCTLLFSAVPEPGQCGWLIDPDKDAREVRTVERVVIVGERERGRDKKDVPSRMMMISLIDHKDALEFRIVERVVIVGEGVPDKKDFREERMFNESEVKDPKAALPIRLRNLSSVERTTKVIGPCTLRLSSVLGPGGWNLQYERNVHNHAFRQR